MKPCLLSEITPAELARFLDEHVDHYTVTPQLLEPEIYGDPDISDEDVAAVRDDTGGLRGIFVSVVRPWSDPLVATLQLFVVGRGCRGTGLAAELLAELEHRLHARGVGKIHVLSSGGYYLLPGLDPRHQRAYHFLLKHGYTRDPVERINMVADLGQCSFDTSELERRLAEQGTDIRRARQTDRGSMYAFCMEQFNATWAHEVDRTFDNRPISLFVADQQPGSPVGFAAYGARYQWFGPMGVRQDVRGCGIGRILLLKALAGMHSEFGIDRAVIPWVGPTEFYTRTCGAVVDTVYWGMHKTVAE